MIILKIVMILVSVFFVMPGCATGPVVTEHDVAKGAIKGLDYANLEKVISFRSESEVYEVRPEIDAILGDAEKLSVSEYQKSFDLPQTGNVHKIGPGDTVSIAVEEDKRFNKEITIMNDGFIFLPLLGRCQVDGLNRVELEQLIANKLIQGKYILDPHVDVLLKSFSSKKTLVIGNVNRTGYFPLQPGERVLDLIFKAGGGELIKGRRSVILLRSNQEKNQKLAIEIKTSQLVQQEIDGLNILLIDGDTLYFPAVKKMSVYILGEVKSPGEIILSGDKTSLIEAIGKAGGFTRIAAKNRVRVIRRVKNENQDINKIFVVNVETIIKKGLKEKDLILLPDDIIEVPESFF